MKRRSTCCRAETYTIQAFIEQLNKHQLKFVSDGPRCPLKTHVPLLGPLIGLKIARDQTVVLLLVTLIHPFQLLCR
jgi:hypothetical protein